MPSGVGIALVTLMAATAGALAATRAPSSVAALAAQLAGGQAVTHLVLSASGHDHAGGHSLAPAMLAAHLAAVVVGAVLIAAGSRLCRALSSVVRALTAVSAAPPRSATAPARTADQPFQSMLLLAASVSHRGPPVSLLR
ncbi:MAG TPA: hypothetical protein VFB19_01000 [Mycobacterium sp.]|nr:hypothetical protein [Mycobacterium sp.]